MDHSRDPKDEGCAVPSAATPARNDPGPPSFRLVTSITPPPSTPLVRNRP